MEYLLEEWDTEQNLPMAPDTVARGSSKKAAWKCANGHTWETTIKVRTAGAKCPFCSGKRVMAGDNSFRTLYPELAKQWDTVIPYLEERKLSPWVHRKTIQKAVESYRITEEEKTYLKTLRG